MPSPSHMVLTGITRAGAGVAAAPPLLALTNFYSTSAYNTLAAGGEAGVSTGFGTITFGRPRVVPTNTGVFRSKISSTGWQQLYSPSGFSCNYNNGSGFIAGPYSTIAASDVGRASVFVSRITAVPGVIEQAVNMVWHNTTPAMTGYSAAANQEVIGNNATGSYPSSDFDITATVDFRGTPTRAQIDAFILAARALGDLPTTFAGATITYRWSLKETLAGLTVVHGQAGPTTMADSVTGLTANVMTKSGTPLVRRTEASVDGRKSNALMNAAVGSAYRSAVGVGPRGSASGHWAAMVATLRTSASGSTEYLMDVSGSTDGYRIVRIPGTDRFEIYCFGAVNVTSGVANIVATDREIPQVVLYTYDGTTHAIRLARGIVISGAGGYAVPSTTRQTTLLGDRVLTASAPSAEIFAAAAGDVALTTPEIDAIFATFDSTRTLVTPAAKTVWSVDVALDAAVNGGAEIVPPTLQDRVGTAHLAREGVVAVQTGPNSIRGLGPFAAGQLLSAPVGLAGSPSGFHVVIDVVLTALPTGNETIACNAPAGGTPGWYLAMNASGVRFVQGGVVASNYAPLNSGHLNTRTRIVGQYSGSTLHIEVNGVAPADVASGTTYAVPSAPMLIGGYSATQEPFKSGWVESIQGGNTVLTSGELTTTNANRTIAPPVVAGKTQKRWLFESDIAASGGIVPPSVAVERIGGAVSDELRRTGAGLILTRRTDRLYGFEASPVMRGFTPSASNHYQTAAALADVGNVASWWYVIARQDNQSAPSTQLLLSSNPSGSAGITIFAGTNFVAAGVSGASGGTFNSSGNVTLPATDVGKVDVIMGVYTGTNLQLYRKRVLGINGAGSFTPGVSTSPLYFGSENNAGPRVASSWTIFGGGAGVGVPTLAQYQALYDWVVSEDGQAQPMPMLATAHVWRIPPASAWPATVTDVGASPNNLTRVGSPADVPNYVRAMAA